MDSILMLATTITAVVTYIIWLLQSETIEMNHPELVLRLPVISGCPLKILLGFLKVSLEE